jgi:hypothetical protein
VRIWRICSAPARARSLCVLPLCRRPIATNVFIRLNGELTEHRVGDVADVRLERQGLPADHALIKGCAAAIVLMLKLSENGAGAHRVDTDIVGPSSRDAGPLAVEPRIQIRARGVRVFSSGFLPEKTACTLRRAAWQFVRPLLKLFTDAQATSRVPWTQKSSVPSNRFTRGCARTR